MILPVQVTFRNMEPSTPVEDWVREEAAKLDELYGHIVGCRVVIELPNRRRKSGSLHHVRIDLTVPGAELVVKRQPSLHSTIERTGGAESTKHLEVRVPHKDLRQAIDDAFKAMGRRLQDHARRERGDVKTHEPMPQGRVTKLFPIEGYGFLETPGGREVYFHKNSVLDGGFSILKTGAKVRFSEEEGEKGPQASSVLPLHPEHIRRGQEASEPVPESGR
jgi:cold shock CspA family protein/ribosome-associated translation inhibitor RaiA